MRTRTGELPIFGSMRETIQDLVAILWGQSADLLLAGLFAILQSFLEAFGAFGLTIFIAIIKANVKIELHF